MTASAIAVTTASAVTACDVAAGRPCGRVLGWPACCGAFGGRRFACGLAEAYADHLDWHQIAELLQRGCPPRLALRIVR